MVNHAATRPGPTGTAIGVLSIVDIRRWEGLPTLIADAKRAARVLGRLLRSLIGLGSKFFLILDVARAWGDLILLGSHDRHGFDRLVPGSVSESVALHADWLSRDPPQAT